MVDLTDSNYREAARLREPCCEVGCDKPSISRFMCKHHYYLWRRENMHRLPGMRRSWVTTMTETLKFWEGKCEEDVETAFWEGSWNEHHHMTAFTLEPRSLVIVDDLGVDDRWNSECNLYDEGSGPAMGLPMGYNVVERPEEAPKPRRAPKKAKPGRGHVQHNDYIGPIPGEDLSVKLPPIRKPKKKEQKVGLSVKEAAAVLQVTPATVYGWISTKDLPTVRVGKNNKQLRILEDQLDAWLQDQNGKIKEKVKAEDTDDLPGMSVKDVARFLRLSDGIVRSLIGSGALPARQYSGAWRITREDLYEWIEKSLPRG